MTGQVEGIDDSIGKACQVYLEPSSDIEKLEHFPTDGSDSEAKQIKTERQRADASSNATSDGEGEVDQRDDDENHQTTSIASRVLSRMTSRSSVAPGPPPDGGFTAWMCVLSGHLVIMNTWGVINSFGVFQPHYTSTLNRAPSDISWIGSFEIFLLFFIGTFTGRLTDAGFFRPLFATGSVLVVAGTFATSFCTQYWQFFLAQGVCMGLGNGFLFCPCLALLATYFQKRRALAIGISACGSATGGLVFPSIVRELLPRIGFGWTMRVIGFIQLATMLVSFFFLKPRIAPRKAGKLVEWAAFAELEYTFYALGSFLCFMGVYFAFFYLASYSRDIQGLSYINSLNLLLLLNGIGVIGRLLPNYVADTLGTLNMFIPMAGISSLLAFSWMAVSSEPGLYAWAVFYGIAAGGIQSLFPAGLSALTADPRKQGTRMGMVFTIVSFAVLTGPPIAGAVIDATGGRYVGAQAFAGSCMALGMGGLMAAREVKRRKLGRGVWAKV
ncbi:riboflavin transporter MCH5 [Verticillium dahliae VdLs.17]|uniref:Riboflavin transporter MCH5 n=1 Tax=Verticillium dahliae (strain VdLs.17 / ATCC MYA-4575 / FGSC 10137) TaxID=498257 RepID=G2WVG2_VERDV|nr:riboflavin transporter MCH5 [Verticillium dahliae VdLs.17]EGY20287.1 riboflavin transporter MCH5 [Verticillium dahliae VdLs.17]